MFTPFPLPVVMFGMIIIVIIVQETQRRIKRSL